MSTERHSRVKALFLAVCERPAEERSSFLEHECAGDDELRAEVESLLGFHSDGDDRIGGLAPAAPAAEDVPERIGCYRVLRVIGEGGMGIVVEAEQESPVRRRVAVKLVRLGMATREVISRFESERQALALMNHPNVATVLDAGATESGRPYFAMELVDGEPITRYCERHRLTTPQRVALLIQVCRGVQHAHQKGVIHRDLKPSNVLVTTGEAGPIPKVIDFGVAKAVGGALGSASAETRLGEWIGTPAYMSPEQADPGGTDVDTRTDVYALGVMLYELLTGALPFEDEGDAPLSADDLRRRIRDQEPVRPSTRAAGIARGAAGPRGGGGRAGGYRALRGDLDWITMKALEKDRTRRYGSPAELAADLERLLRSEPVLAGPPSPVYRVRKFIRRHRVSAAAAALVAAALVLGAVAATVGLLRAEREAASATEAMELLIGVFAEIDPTLPAERKASVRRILDIGAERVESSLSGRPREQARLMYVIGNVYSGLGYYREAGPLLDHALELQQANIRDDGDRAAVAATLNSLGWLHAMTADYVRTGELFEEAAAISESARGPRDSRTVAYLAHSGWLSWKVGRLTDASVKLDLALERAAGLRESHPLLVSDILFYRGVLQRSMRRYQDALRSLEECAALRRQHAGPDNYRLGWALFDLGLTYEWTGRLADARTYFEKALRIHETALGPRHMAVGYPLHHLGLVALAEGDSETARARIERALTIRREALGADHPDVAWSLQGLARLEQADGRPDLARRHLRRALDIQTSAFGPDHPDVIVTLNMMARLEQDAGRTDEAARLARRLEDVLRRPPSWDRPTIGRDLYWVACLEARAGHGARAVSLVREAIGLGFVDGVVLDDPDFAGLVGDPEYEAVRAEVRRRLGDGPG